MPKTPDGTAFEIHGTPGAPPVVLIHGLGLNRDCWQWTIPALADGYEILAYDLYGHGASDDPMGPVTLRLFSDQLRQLLDHCQIPAARVIGFSLGGMIARRFAQACPDRTSALAILHSPHQRTPEAQAAILARVEQARDIGPEATVEAALTRWFTDAFRAARPDIMDTVRAWVLANRAHVYHRIYRVLAEGVAEITCPTPPITCPALVITGDEDFGNGPEMTQAIAQEIPGAEALILTGLRHMALAEDPDALNQPLRAFLDAQITPNTPA